MLIAKLNGQKLTVVSDTVVSDSVKYLTVRFEFSREWAGFLKTAIFFGNDGSTYSVPMLEGNSMYLGENTCYVPYEVIKNPSFEISVFGTSGEKVITSDKAAVGVRESGYCEGEAPADPTPDEYSQLMDAANYALEEAELAKQIASDNSSDFQNQLDSKMDKFAEITETETERKIVLDEFSGKYGDTNAVMFESKYGHSQLKLTDSGEAYFKVADCIIKKEITGGNFWDLDNCGFRNVAAPEEENDAATKGYVDNLVSNAKEELSPDQNYDPESTNAQSGLAVSEAIANEVNKFCDVAGDSIVLKKGVIATDRIMLDYTPTSSTDAVPLGYVDNFAYPKKFSINNGDTILCGEYTDGDVIRAGFNLEYTGVDINSLTLVFSLHDFMCSLFFTTAAEGDINIVFPESAKFIGAAPIFGNGETWEFNIKNGVAVGGKVV